MDVSASVSSHRIIRDNANSAAPLPYSQPSALGPQPCLHATLRAPPASPDGRSFPASRSEFHHGTSRRQCRGARSTRCRHHHPALHEPRREPRRSRKSRAMDFVTRSRSHGRGRDRARTASAPIPITPFSARNPAPAASRRQGLGHRPARRHAQLPARLSAFLRLDRLSRSRRSGARA